MSNEQGQHIRRDLDIRGNAENAFGEPYAEIFDSMELGRLAYQVYRVYHPDNDLLDTDAAPDKADI